MCIFPVSAENEAAGACSPDSLVLIYSINFKGEPREGTARFVALHEA